MSGDGQFEPWGDPSFEQSVRDTAYFMWENDGRPNGREQEYWYRALESCLRQHNLDQALAEPVTLSEVVEPEPTLRSRGKRGAEARGRR